MPVTFSSCPDEHELVEAVDAEEDRCVGRVDDLVAAGGRRAASTGACEMPLRVRAEIELGLLDQDDEPAHPARIDGALQSSGRVRALRRSLLGHARTSIARLAGESVRAISVDGRRWAGKKERGGAAPPGRELSVAGGQASRNKVRSPRTASTWTRAYAPRDVVAERHRRGRLEQGPDRRQDGRLARRRLADEHARASGLEDHVAGAAIALDRNPGDQRPSRLYPRSVFFTKNRRFAGRSPRRRIRYGYHSGPYGVATRHLVPASYKVELEGSRNAVDASGTRSARGRSRAPRRSGSPVRSAIGRASRSRCGRRRPACAR